MRQIAPQDPADAAAIETREWQDSLDYVLQSGGPARVAEILSELEVHARRRGLKLPFTANTPYVNTIGVDEQTPVPGSNEIERRIKSLVRWNAMAMVVKANLASDGIGGHISTFASSATLYEVGLQPLLQGQGPRAGRRLRLLPGPRLARHVLARLPRRPPVAAAARELPPRAEARRRPVVVPAPVADARLLGSADGVDGPRPDHVDLPGALLALPGGSRPQAAHRSEGVGVPRRRRDRRARGARRHLARLAREARQPDLRHQLQPAAARRPGPRQRPHRPGARSGLPRRRLERHQGAVGPRVGRAVRARPRGPAAQARRRDRRRRVPEVLGDAGRLHPRSSSSAPTRGC